MIWCVEDDASIRDIEVYALTSTGFEAKGFENGDSFWKALQSEKPELVVLDKETNIRSINSADLRIFRAGRPAWEPDFFRSTEAMTCGRP